MPSNLPISNQLQSEVSMNGSGTGVMRSASGSLAGATGLQQLLESLEKLMAEKYAFDVFAKDSINFGILITYRQTWKPLNYQTGDLVKTIPLAPKEVRRYTTKTVVKKTRSEKELEDSLQNLKKETADTSRADSEIVQKAQNKTNFQMNSEESFSEKDVYNIKMNQMNAGESANQSERTKKYFRESVMKSAEEYKHEHKTEIEFTSTEETETTTFHEIQNPNDELTVTYLLYELQRTYRISEKIHALTPVIFVANEVPAPDEITDAWLVENGWILNRVILDDSFRPALQYLLNSFTADEINISILEDNAILQQNIVRSLTQQLSTENQVVASGEAGVRSAILQEARGEAAQGIFNAIKSVFDPIGITGKTDLGTATAAQAMVDFAKDSLDRADKERSRLLTQLQLAVTALQGAIDKLSAAVKDHYNQLAQIDRMRIHIKENILYLMQAIWDHEPPDQRCFRLYNIDVPMITAQTVGAAVDVYISTNPLTLGTFTVQPPCHPSVFPPRNSIKRLI